MRIIEDKSIPVKEIAIFRREIGWLPCQFPERPLDETAAIKHIKEGEPCKACEIAYEAFIKSNGRYHLWSE